MTDLKKTNYIATAAEEGEQIMQRTVECFRGFAYCLNGSREMGVIYGDGVYEKGKICGTKAMRQAYQTGLSV